MGRTYPKRCPKCNEYMEPIFEEGLSGQKIGQHIRNIHQEPMGWKCDCGATEIRLIKKSEWEKWF